MLPHDVFPLHERLRQMQHDHEHEEASRPLFIGLGQGHIFVFVEVRACPGMVCGRDDVKNRVGRGVQAGVPGGG